MLLSPLDALPTKFCLTKFLFLFPVLWILLALPCACGHPNKPPSPTPILQQCQVAPPPLFCFKSRWHVPPLRKLRRLTAEPYGKAFPHPDLPQRDVQFLAEHPEVWVHVDRHDLARQVRIIEGWRQMLNLATQGGSTGVCPVTGKACGRKGYGPYGIHTECVTLDYN